MSTVEGVPYGFLLDIYKETDYIYSKFSTKAIQEKISTYIYWKARWFFHTVAPCTPSILGNAKIAGNDLKEYRKKLWYSRICNTGIQKCTPIHANTDEVQASLCDKSVNTDEVTKVQPTRGKSGQLAFLLFYCIFFYFSFHFCH